jgi:hypothetical protein
MRWEATDVGISALYRWRKGERELGETKMSAEPGGTTKGELEK